MERSFISFQIESSYYYYYYYIIIIRGHEKIGGIDDDDAMMRILLGQNEKRQHQLPYAILCFKMSYTTAY